MMSNLFKIQLFISFIKDFFRQNEFLEVMTPTLVENPGMETHIHPMQVQSIIHNKQIGYLHTSPEFELKYFMAHVPSVENIFNISFCFRDEPTSPIHRSQFLMLEWYRKNQYYDKIKEDISHLINHCLIHLKQHQIATLFQPHQFQIQHKTVDECFQQYLGFSILDYLDKDQLKNKIKNDYPDVPLPTVDLSWDDYFFLLFLNKVEPEIAKIPMVIIDQYPHPLSALSTINSKDPRVCDRFEIYINGVEIANCYNELTNLTEQKRRFEMQAKEKLTLYHYQLSTPHKFYAGLAKGLPTSCGIALGVERLLQALTGENEIFYLDA
jgi:elongation factor P--(R)-beta-lysine ligase